MPKIKNSRPRISQIKTAMSILAGVELDGDFFDLILGRLQMVLHFLQKFHSLFILIDRLIQVELVAFKPLDKPIEFV
jgi:hypothetical protein